MAEYRLKIKIGDYEFDAEGDPEVVQAQFQIFKELVSSAPANPPAKATAETPATNGGNSGDPAETLEKPAENQLQLDKIMNVEGRVISLTVRAGNVDEGVLLMLLGQRHFRGNNAVTGREIVDGLTISGQRFNRTDRVINRLSGDESGLVITIGQGKGRRYRLTNAGIAAAQDIARRLIALVP